MREKAAKTLVEIHIKCSLNDDYCTFGKGLCESVGVSMLGCVVNHQ